MSTPIGAHIRQAGACALAFALGLASAMHLPVDTALLPAPERIFGVLRNLTPDISLLTAAQFLFAAGAVLLCWSLHRYGLLAWSQLTAASKSRPVAAVNAKTTPLPREERTKEVEAVLSNLDRELAEVVSFVSAFLASSNAQSTAMARAEARLAKADTVEQIRAIVTLLVSTSAQAQRDANDLRKRLNEAQAQTVAMREKLSRAEELATIDGLTALPNRRRFQEFLDEQVQKSHEEDTPLCLVMTDVDHFKKVNDQFGHQAGDAVLKEFARVLSTSIRSTDMVGRYGGEEFALVLPNTPLGNASSLAERICRGLADVWWTDGNSGRPLGNVTASFGVAEIRDGETGEQLVARADRKLYEAKHRGRNRVEVDSKDLLEIPALTRPRQVVT